jgi:hypothetical protein
MKHAQAVCCTSGVRVLVLYHENTTHFKNDFARKLRTISEMITIISRMAQNVTVIYEYNPFYLYFVILNMYYILAKRVFHE